MIILDIETSGLLPDEHALLSLGAVDYDSGAEFYDECQAHVGHTLDPIALGVNGFTEAQCRDATKQTPDQLVAAFTAWAQSLGAPTGVIIGGQQVGSFDVPFLHEAAGGKVAFEKVFSRRMVDLHSVAYAKLGKSLSLDGILQAVGLAPEPKPHNALTGARLERDAFKLLLS